MALGDLGKKVSDALSQTIKGMSDIGKATIEAIDITNTIIFVSTLSVASKKLQGTFGLGSVELIIRFLSTMKDPKLNVKISENRLCISREDNKRRLDYLLSQPELIATRPMIENTDIKKHILDGVEVTGTMNESFVKDFNSYITTLKTKIVTITIDDESIEFALGPKSEHQFEAPLHALVEECGQDVALGQYGRSCLHLRTIMQYPQNIESLSGLRLSGFRGTGLEQEQTAHPK